MGSPRLRNFSEDAVNIALEQLYKNILNAEKIVTSSAGLSDSQVSEINNAIAEVKNSLEKYVPVTRKINDLPLERDIVLDANNINYDETQTLFQKIDNLMLPVAIHGYVNTVADLPTDVPNGWTLIVANDETHNGAQWLWTYNDGTWTAIAPFGVNLALYYTKNELYNRLEIDQKFTDNNAIINNIINTSATNTLNQAQAQTDNAINAERISVNNLVSNSISNLKNYTDNELNNLQDIYVPQTRKINNNTLTQDIIISALDIPYQNQSVSSVLDTLTSVISIIGAVDNVSDLPANAVNGNAYIVRNGVNEPVGTPEVYVFGNKQWKYLSKFTLDLDLYYTKGEIDNKLNQETTARETADTDLQNQINNTNSQITQVNTNLTNSINNETSRATAREDQLSADILSSQINAIQEANNYTDLEINNLHGAIDGKVDKTFMPPLLSDLQITQDASSVTNQLSTISLAGQTDSKQVPIPIASDSQAGVISSNTFTKINNISDRVDNLEQQGSYIGQSFNTYADLMAYNVPSWITVNNFTYVINDETHPQPSGDPTSKYVWANVNGVMQWSFAFIVNYDPPEKFTNNTLGIILGSALDGYLSAQADGTGAVNGWSTVKADIVNAAAVASGARTYAESVNTNLTNQINTKADKLINGTAKTNVVKGNYNADGQLISATNAIPSDVGLGNVTNDAQVKRTEMGVPNGVATLGSDGKVPAAQLQVIKKYTYLCVLQFVNNIPPTAPVGRITFLYYTDTVLEQSNLTYLFQRFYDERVVMPILQCFIRRGGIGDTISYYYEYVIPYNNNSIEIMSSENGSFVKTTAASATDLVSVLLVQD